MDKLTKQKLMERVTHAVVNRLNWLRLSRLLTDKEIADKAGIHRNRISEWRRYRKYKKAINAADLKKLMESGVITLENLVNPVELSEEDLTLLTNLIINDCEDEDEEDV